MSELTVAIAGATGAVGREMMNVLEEREFPLSSLKLLASKRSAGEKIEFKGSEITVEELKEDSFDGIDVALFSAGGSVSKEFSPIAADSGAIVIDNSSAFRMDEAVPLVVPEVNGELVRDQIALRDREGFIIANPNCSTIQLVVALKPLQDRYGLERVVVSTYQSVSGAGKKGMDELWNQTQAIYTQGEVQTKAFPHRIAFNCIPHIDVFMDNGYTKEEVKVIKESRKIMNLPELRITCTAVRVPVFSCHSESVNIQTSEPTTAEDIRDTLSQAPGILVLDNPANNEYPHGVDLVGTDATYVGRIREDESAENAFNLWVVADNLRKGAALNAVQIAEIVANER